MNNKLTSAIGFAMKAGRIKSGGYVVEKLIRAKQAHLALIDTTASDNTKDQYRDMCAYANTELIEIEELGHWIGKPGRMVAAVTDEVFTAMIKRALAQTEVMPQVNETNALQDETISPVITD
jgi:ribosomal protein L7Ae-like RNA K-turn-binding protein